MRSKTTLAAIALTVCALASPLAAQVNLAPLGTAAQSSEYNGGQFPAALALDGNLGNFTHTDVGLGPAIWEVDLGADREIESIVLFNRGGGCCQSRMRDIVVSIHAFSFLADDPIFEVDVADPADPADILPLWDSAIWESDMLNSENVLGGGGVAGPASITVDLVAAPVTGRFVRVTRIPDLDLSGTGGQGNDGEPRTLSLGEVQVFGSIGADQPPLITRHPAPGRAAVGDRFVLTVEATGTEPLAYRWLKDSTPVPGATSSTLEIDPVALADDAIYEAEVSNEFGAETSNPARLTVLEFPNLARFGVASQSTTGYGGLPGRANDGNTNGVYGGNSVSHTNDGDPTPWWEVELIGDTTIHSIVLWNRTDCCSVRLTNFRVLILDIDRNTLFDDEYFTDGVSFPDTALEGFTIDVEPPLEGRIARVELIEDPLRAQPWLSLAEVEVFGVGPTLPDVPNPDLARQRNTAQSSTLAAYGAGLGVDGNPGTFTHTTAGQAPAIWEVDLGAASDIGFLRLVNRVDCCGSRLRDIVVSLHNISFTADDSIADIVDVPPDQLGQIWDSALWESDLLNPENALGDGLTGPAVLEIVLPAVVSARYVRVTRVPDRDLSGTGGQGNADEADVLSLGSVEVYDELECPATGDTTCDGLAVVGPPENDYGDYSVSASASDASGEDLSYTFTADNGAGNVQTRGPQIDPTATFRLTPGTWTISVTVDDDFLCDDTSAGATCSEVVEVIDVRCRDLGECNLALTGTATQSSTGFNGPADRAIDGNTDGVYNNGSMSHTATGDLAPWWEVDLGRQAAIDKLLLWNRVDCCANRLHNFRVLLLDEVRDEVTSIDLFTDGTFPDTTFEGFEVELDGAIGQIVRIEHLGDITGAGLFISLAEVQVFGEPEEVICPIAGDADFGDTRCTGVTIEGPAAGGPGIHTITATGSDATADALFYSFRADNGQGTVLNAGPQRGNTASFDLALGTWTVTVTTDDNLRCPDTDPGAVCTQTVTVADGGDGVRFIRGDTNTDGAVNISDASFLLNFLFLGGTDPQCAATTDANGDGGGNISDASFILNFLFLGGLDIPPPNACPDGPTADAADCAAFPPCAG